MKEQKTDRCFHCNQMVPIKRNGRAADHLGALQLAKCRGSGKLAETAFKRAQTAPPRRVLP